MYKILFFFFFIFSTRLSAQIFPYEGSKLCYRIIGFSFPAQPSSVKYKIEISAGIHNTENSFERNIITSLFTKKNKAIAEVPSFGCQYTWRTISFASNNVITKSTLHHFSVGITPDADTNITRLRVIKVAEKYKDAYIFIDGNKVLYDMKGNPVWFLPGTELKSNQNVSPRDLKLTPQGSITFLTGGHPYEIDYLGNILWGYKYNMPGETKVFHHEFTRMSNGHYMGMIYEDISGYSRPLVADSAGHESYDSAGFFRSRLFSSIVEYDENSNLVWRWSGMEYEHNSDLHYRKTIDCSPADFDLHENSFFFDEKNKVIYLSFRNINRIIKIKYPEGNVLNTYGPQYAGTPNMTNDLFCGQHSCISSVNDYLYLFNNNTCHAGLPTIQMFQEPAPGMSDLKKIWEYQCTADENVATGNTIFYSGGSVLELPDQSVLAMVGMPYPKVFIVSHDKKVLWSAVPEKYDPVAKKWQYIEEYRANIIVNRKDLEQLIWKSEKQVIKQFN